MVLSGSTFSTHLTIKNLSTPFNALFRQCAILSLLRQSITILVSIGILTDYPSTLASQLSLRTRLTLIRLSLIRKPWSSGVRVSHPHYRYLCLHLLFYTLQYGSRLYLLRSIECSPTDLYFYISHGFGSMLMPVYYPCTTARLVSCYALFK